MRFDTLEHRDATHVPPPWAFFQASFKSREIRKPAAPLFCSGGGMNVNAIETPRQPAFSRAERTRRDILALISDTRPLTADEVASRLDLSILYVRPRVSELVARGDLIASGRCGRNASGKPAKKWRVTVKKDVAA
jgi:hypothetical protein